MRGPNKVIFLSQLKKLSGELALKRIEFTGALYGEEKIKAYQNADIYVLPTKSENFAMTIAEALAAGSPVITTKGAPWRDLPTHDAGWWIDIGVNPLIAALDHALNLDQETLAKMGQNGRTWMKRDFSWRSVANRMVGFYQWLIEGGNPPSYVRID